MRVSFLPRLRFTFPSRATSLKPTMNFTSKARTTSQIFEVLLLLLLVTPTPSYSFHFPACLSTHSTVTRPSAHLNTFHLTHFLLPHSTILLTSWSSSSILSQFFTLLTPFSLFLFSYFLSLSLSLSLSLFLSPNLSSFHSFNSLHFFLSFFIFFSLTPSSFMAFLPHPSTPI